MIANAFTCTGPYALLIMLGLKRVENRGAAPEPRKGRCAISCLNFRDLSCRSRLPRNGGMWYNSQS